MVTITLISGYVYLGEENDFFGNPAPTDDSCFSLPLPQTIELLRYTVRHYRLYLFVFIFGIIAVSCSPTRKLSLNQKLLVRQEVAIDNKNINQEEVENLIIQKPNQRFLGIWHLNLWVQQHTSQGEQTRFKKWLRRSAGRPPAIFNASDLKQSEANIQSYMYGKGYFKAIVESSVHTEGNTVSVNWDIVTDTPWLIRNYNVVAEDSIIGNLVKHSLNSTLIKTGRPYDVATLQLERDRVTTFLRNEGYFAFSNDYVVFEVDSSLRSRQMDVYINIRNPRRLIGFSDNQEIYGKDRHKKYYIDNVWVYPQYSTLRSIQARSESKPDTVHWYIPIPGDSTGVNRLSFIYNEKSRIRTSTLIESISIKQGDRYNLRHAENTYQSLSALPIYRSININYTPSERKMTGEDTATVGLLDCAIQMSKNNVMAFSVEADGTNSGGDLGVSGNFSFLNRNIFRGGELLNVKLRGALEMQQTLGDPEQNKVLLFNTVEVGADVSVIFPRFLAPFKSYSLPRYLRPQTSLTSGFNLQFRPDYRRYITNIGFGYRWKTNSRITHYFTPIEVNSVRIFPTAEFEAKLEKYNERLKNQYTNHFITSLKYSFIYNNQQYDKVHDYYFFRADLESAGNALYLIDNIVGAPRDADGNFTLFNIRYAQYLRANFDFRYFKMFDQNNMLAVRGLIGIGKPYGNAVALPFEKGFYAGGANGMRGWNLKNLGPGSFSDPNGEFTERMGDLQLESNIEFRFPMYAFVKGALFVDAGNIWLLSDIPAYNGGKFKTSTFVSEFAMDAGLGFRFDFTFFVFRIDAALPVRNPAKPAGERWVVSKSRMADILWNFGIGYPF